jgi:Tol biopolymer transport system component
MKIFPALPLIALALAVPATVQAGPLELVSRAAATSRSATAGGKSAAWQISLDGRYLLFLSDATNLIAGQRDGNGGPDLFLFDRVAGKTALVTHAAGSPLTTANAPVPLDYRFFQMTPDGRYVAYTANAGDLVAGQNGPATISLFLYDRVTGTNLLVSHKASSAATPGNQASGGPFRITDAGSVAFSSGATDLVSPGLASDGASNVFFWDRTSGKITLISHAAGDPAAARGSSQAPSVSGDGRWIAFSSNAPDLVAGLTLSSSQGDVFLHDRATGKTLLVSRANPAANAAAGNGSSLNPLVSAGGNYVLFTSRATNLALGQKDANSDYDAFLFERSTGKVTLLSHAAGRATTAAQGFSIGGAITPDGQWIAFGSTADDILPGQTETAHWNTGDVFLYERATGKVLLASRAAASPVTAPDFDCGSYSLSADGRKVAFSSRADNLLANGADTNEAEDAFVFDRVTGKTTLVSAVSPGVPANGASTAPLLSADGRWVGYTSEATNLAGRRRDTNGLSDVFLRDTATGAARLVTPRAPALPSLTPRGKSLGWTVSADGRYVAFTSAAPDLVPRQVDANNNDDAFVYDRALGKTTLVSRSAASPVTTGNGIVYDVQISADGRFALYLSTSTNAVPGQEDVDDGEAFDLFLFELATGTTTLVTHAAGSPTRTGNHGSGLWAEMSADATWIAYAGQATDLVAGQGPPSSPYDRNAFLYNRLTGETTLLSHRHDSALQPANAETIVSAVSADGQVVLLSSRASDLIPPVAPDLDTNGDDDVFVVDRGTGITTLISRTTDTPPRAAGGRYPRMSRDGRMISFVSDGDDLVPGQIDGDRTGDLFLHDRQSGATTLVSHAAGSAETAVGAFGMALSGGGRWLAFTSEATDVVAGQTDANEGDDVFLYDRDTGTTRLVSHVAGSPATAAHTRVSNLSSISDDGRYVAFLSRAADLVTGLTGPAYLPDNVYVWDRTAGTNVLLTRSALFPGRYGNADSLGPVFAAGGSGVMFSSNASDLVTGDFTLDPYGRSFQDVFFYPLP